MGYAIMSAARDVHISLRSLLRAPMLAATIIATVGLGIGATTVMFAVIDAALLRPLPYKDPQHLVRIYTDAPPYWFPFSVADYQALEAQQTTFSAVAAYTNRAMAFSNGRIAERVQAKVVTWTYFDLLGITPALGRTFAAADGRPGSPPVVIVSNEFWQQRLGGRDDAIGQSVRLDGVDHLVVGVLPRTLGPLERRRDVFVAAQWTTPRRKGPFFITALGRLPAEGSRAAAAAELREINRRIFPLWKSSYQNEKASWGLVDLKTYVAGNFSRIAGVSLAAVAFVWLIACVNASNLLVARVTSRRRELAVRTALGASRWRVVRHLLTEAALLAILAAALGIALASMGVDLVRTYGVDIVPRTQEIALSGRTLLVLIAITATSCAIFGLIPALHGSGGPVDEGLRSLGRTATAGGAARRLRSVLVGSQFAVATPLLVVAGLLVGTLNHLRQVDLGFDHHNVLTGAVLLPEAQYREASQVKVFWDELQRRVAALPGVTAVSFADSRPPEDAGNQNNFDLEDTPASAAQSQPVTTWVAVTPDYFPLLKVRLIEGRLFDNRDTSTESPSVIVVDQAWAKRFFPGQSALGKRLKGGGCSTCEWTTVVGVVTGVKYDGLATPDQGVVYTPIPTRGDNLLNDSSSRERYLIVRTATSPSSLVASVRQVVHDLDPSLPFSSVASVEDLVADSLQQPRGLSLVIGALAAIALVLSVVGIYGVMAYYVQQHAKDISIRMALGGRPMDVLRLTIGRGMRLVAAGVAIGIFAAFAMSRLVASLLFGVGATDPLTFAGVTSVMLGVSLVACLAPAARAVRLEPSVVLRNE